MTIAIKVVDAVYLSDYCILITFSDNSQRTIDFQEFLEKNPHPQFNEYRDLKKFKSFHIERGNIVWGEDWDLIFPVEELYAGKINS